MKYSIGQKLWYEPGFYKREKGKEITISKIGKIYLECDGLHGSKLKINNLTEKANSKNNDSYYSGQAYLSKEHYEKEIQRKEAANILWYEIEKRRNKLSMEQIERIWDILKQVDNNE